MLGLMSFSPTKRNPDYIRKYSSSLSFPKPPFYLRGKALLRLEASLSYIFVFLRFTDFRLIYNLSISKENLSPCLYERYEKVLQSYLRLKAIDDIFNSEGDLGEIVVQKWQNHQLMVRWMRIMFSYLDRFHVKFNALSSLHDRGKPVVTQAFKYSRRKSQSVSKTSLLLTLKINSNTTDSTEASDSPDSEIFPICSLRWPRIQKKIKSYTKISQRSQ